MPTLLVVTAFALAAVFAPWICHARPDAKSLDALAGKVAVHAIRTIGAVARVTSMRGLIIDAKSSRRCIAKLSADGSLTVPGWCKSLIPAIGRVSKWRWVANDILLSGAHEEDAILFRAQDANSWTYAVGGVPVLRFYRLTPEVEPH